MMTILFERFWLLLGLGVVLTGVAYMRATEQRTKCWRLAVGSVPVIFAILLTINVWVVTDREAIRKQLTLLVEACKKSDTVSLGQLMDNDFSANGMDKKELLGHLKDAFDRLSIADVRLTDVQINPPTPVVRLASFAHVVGKSGEDYTWIRSDWELTFRKQKGQWMLYEVRPLSLFAEPIKDIREILNRSHTFR